MGGFYLLVANRKDEPGGRERKTLARANTDNTLNQGQIFPFIFKYFFLYWNFKNHLQLKESQLTDKEPPKDNVLDTCKFLNSPQTLERI